MWDSWAPGFVPALVKASQILAILTLGLYLGQRGAKTARRGWLTLSIFLLAGLAAGYVLSLPANAVATGLFVVTALAGCAAVLSGPPFPWGYGLAVMGGIALGAAARPFNGDWPDAAVIVAANLIGASFLTFSISGAADWAYSKANRFWLRIGVRIAAAWMVAIAIMMLALSLAQ